MSRFVLSAKFAECIQFTAQVLMEMEENAELQALGAELQAHLLTSDNPAVELVNLPPARSSKIRVDELPDLLLAIERFGGDKSAAARWLGISRSTLYSRLRRAREAARQDTPLSGVGLTHRVRRTREAIAAVSECGGDRSAAATRLGVSRSTLQERLARFDTLRADLKVVS